MEGVLVSLYDNTFTIIATTLTDSSGNYLFADLPPGSYIVTEQNRDDVNLDVKDSDGGDSPNEIAVLLGGDNPLHSVGNDFVDEKCRKNLI